MDMTSYIIGRKSAGGGSDITIDDVIAITGELDNLSTTDKSNLVNAINEVASSGGGEQIPTLVLDEPYRFNPGGSVTDTTMLSFFSTRITEMLTETPKNGLVLIKYNTSGKTELWSCKDTVATQSDQYNFYLVNTEIKGANYRYALVVRGAWANDIFTCSYIMTVQDSYSFVLPNQVLTKTNTNSYTPTSNYHPSTKLYSDTTVLTKSGLSRHLTSKTYQVGDYVYRSETDLTIYKCNTADTTGTWDASKWDSKTYMEYLSDTLVGGALNGSY